MFDLQSYAGKSKVALRNHVILANGPFTRQQETKWNGWGFNDSQFVYDREKKVIRFTGSRHEIGEKNLPLMREWAIKTLGVDFEKNFEPQVK